MIIRKLQFLYMPGTMLSATHKLFHYCFQQHCELVSNIISISKMKFREIKSLAQSTQQKSDKSGLQHRSAFGTSEIRLI